MSGIVSEPALALSPSELVADRYRPLRPLGSGGSGSVWLARDERTGLDVALKIVPREGKAATRAEREALAAARLRHERCLRAYALERDTRNVYIAYEYVPGQTMRQALRAGDLDDASAVEAGAQVLEALAHAHARGIVHRDVKPSNVLVAEGEAISVRLLDFGLAQLAEEESLTATGDVPGTLAYVPPERLHGEPGEPAADIWAVGVLLWEALAGWHPFWNGSLLETARRIENGAAPLAQVRPDLPKPLCALVDRMLALDPAARPPAALLAHELRDALAERIRRRTRGPRVSLAAAAALRFAVPAAAVLLAAIVAGLRHSALPFTGVAPPKGLGIAGSQDPFAVAVALWRALLDHPALLVEALALAAAAVALPFARERGPWGIAALGAGLIAVTILPAPSVAAAPLVVAAWATCTVLALRARG